MECEEIVASIGNRYPRLNIRVGDVVVGRFQAVVLQVLTFQIECVNHLACAQVDGQVWTTIGCLSGCREIAVNDIAGIGSARKRHRDTGVQCFGFC